MYVYNADQVFSHEHLSTINVLYGFNENAQRYNCSVRWRANFVWLRSVSLKISLFTFDWTPKYAGARGCESRLARQQPDSCPCDRRR